MSSGGDEEGDRRQELEITRGEERGRLWTLGTMDRHNEHSN